jgi:cobalt-zinc-cadmium resistance protein CzcA
VGIAPERAKAVERQVRGILAADPAVRQVVGQLGRPEDGTDPKGFSNLEMLADLKPRREWGGLDKDQVVDRMRGKLASIPGLQLNFSQYIKDNVEEALSGVKGELVVKIFGPDLAVLQEKGEAVRQVLSGIAGVADLGVEQQFGMPQVRLDVKRDALARNGLSVQDVADAIETAVGGKAVTQFLEGERLFDVRLRYAQASRDNLQALQDLALRTPSGALVPLAAVATVRVVEGASRISREMNERRVAIKCSVRGRDEGGFVTEAQRRVAEAVPLPPGYRLTWGGQFENQRRAQERLEVIVPVAIGLIFLLLFTAFGSVRYAALILANVPFALIGGITMLWARGIHLSVAASVGFVALFGIAVQNGIVLLSEFKRLKGEGRDVRQAVREGTDNRLRPVLMTALMAMFGLLPAAFSTKVGAETTRPFASVIVGGLVTSTLLTLVLLPVLFEVFDRGPEQELAA